MNAIARWFAPYADRRIWPLGLVGFSSGLPLLLTGGTLSAWLAESGLSLKSIGAFAAIGAVYSLKFLWSPAVDHLPIPLLSTRLGQRRAWMVASQGCIAVALAVLAWVDPRLRPEAAAWAALATAIASATQDIAVDAFRVERAGPERQGEAAAIAIFGYRIGMLAAGAGALYLADFISWRGAYLGMAALALVGVATTLACGEPARKELTRAAGWKQHLVDRIVLPFRQFASRSGWVAILGFALTFKLGDALAAVMTNPFLLQLGFTKPEIASTTKVFGLFATLAGAAVGGALISRVGLVRGLWIGGALQAISLVVFACQAVVGHHVGVLALTIGFEYFASAIGTAAFAAYLSSLCALEFTATQYALLTSFAAVGRSTLATRSGEWAEQLGWFGFFLLCAAAALPALALLAWIDRRPAPPPTAAALVAA